MTRSRRPPLASIVAVVVVLPVLHTFSRTAAVLKINVPQAILVQADQVTE